MNLQHQLQEHQKRLAQLYIVWEKAFSTLPQEEPGISWELTGAAELLAQARQEVEREVVEESKVDDEDDEGEIFLDEGELDAGLIEYIDALELNDNVRDLGEGNNDDLYYVDC